MLSYIRHMFVNDIRTYGWSTALFNVRFMLAWDFSQFILNGNLKRLTTTEAEEE